MEEKIKLQLQLASSMEDGFQEEEFYEDIEAPKFVDFRLPDHFNPDDRYWFCSRVGCDQRHEEEMDSEAIYKNFVLRVMAARSPNVRLRKALTRRPTLETKKCPLSAPPKSSKSRLPRFAMASSSIPKKLVLDDQKGANKSPAEKPCSTTPKARVKHVAAKYMTTVKKKKPGSPNPNGFRSAGNPKRTSGVRVSKNKVVAKALVFNKTPKKAPQKKVKASEELATPITKLCEGIKKMKISQKSTQQCRSVRKALPSDAPKKQPSHSSRKKNDQTVLGSVKSKVDKRDEKKGWKTRDESSDMEIDGKSRAGSLEPCSGKMKSKIEILANSESTLTVGKMESEVEIEANSENTLTIGKMESKVEIEASSENTLTDESVSNEASNGGVQTKNEDDHVAEDDIENQNPGVVGEVDNQGKGNGSISDNINRNLDGGNLSKHNAPAKHKIKAVDKTLKENCAAGLQGVKYRKLKPTNPKPFRLRTDERGILKEATLDRKTGSNESATVASENMQSTSNELSEKVKKELDKSLKQNLHRPIKSKYMTTSKLTEPKPDRVLVPCSQKSTKKTRPQSQREMVSQLKPRLEESKTKIVKPKEPRKTSKTSADPTSQVPIVAGRKLAAPGRRAATIPREPNFHNLHKPKSCIKNTA